MKQQNKIKFISQPSLPSGSEPDTPQEEEVYKVKPFKNKIKNQIEKDTGLIKGQTLRER